MTMEVLDHENMKENVEKEQKSTSNEVEYKNHLKIKVEYLVSKQRDKSSVVTTGGGGGGNKKRRRNILKIDKSLTLCPTLKDVSYDRYDEKSDLTKLCTFPNCQFMHDIQQFVERNNLLTKTDVTMVACPLFEEYGRCKFGLLCKFSSIHIEKINVEANKVIYRNKINKNKWVKEYDPDSGKPSYNTCESSRIPRSLQDELRRREVDFSKTENAIEKARIQIDHSYENSKDVADGEDEVVASNPNSDDFTVKLDEEADSQHRVNSHSSSAESIRERVRSKKVIEWKDKLYLAPLTTVGNLPFRRLCKKFGADITCGEMALAQQIVQGMNSEWALLKKHESEDLFGVQVCGQNALLMGKAAQLIGDHVDCDFVDINAGCPIDLIYKKGAGSGLLPRTKVLATMASSMSSILASSSKSLTLKIRTGVYTGKNIAEKIVRDVSPYVDLFTLHGRSREQRYTRLSDWSYIQRCRESMIESCSSNSTSSHTPPAFFGNGDVLNYEDYYSLKQQSGVDGIMIGRGALIKPWIFTEIKERRHLDITASQRLEMIKDYVGFGLDHWGSDEKGVENTRKFLLEWLSFQCRYVPHSILLEPPQRINMWVPPFQGRCETETLLGSTQVKDWIKISEMFLGSAPQHFVFEPKHKSNAYS